MITQITLHNSQTDLDINEEKVKSLILKVFDYLNIKTNEVIFHFVNEERIRVIHGLYFGNSDTTDCISFPIDGIEENKDDSFHVIGEGFINPKEALLYSPKAPYEELSRYIIHCILHFIGHQDADSAGYKLMKSKETSILDYLRKEKVLLTNSSDIYK